MTKSPLQTDGPILANVTSLQISDFVPIQLPTTKRNAQTGAATPTRQMGVVSQLSPLFPNPSVLPNPSEPEAWTRGHRLHRRQSQRRMVTARDTASSTRERSADNYRQRHQKTLLQANRNWRTWHLMVSNQCTQSPAYLIQPGRQTWRQS